MDFIPISEAMQTDSGRVAIRGWCWRERNSNKYPVDIAQNFLPELAESINNSDAKIAK